MRGRAAVVLDCPPLANLSCRVRTQMAVTSLVAMILANSIDDRFKVVYLSSVYWNIPAGPQSLRLRYCSRSCEILNLSWLKVGTKSRLCIDLVCKSRELFELRRLNLASVANRLRKEPC
jgi:hypothetical protein